VLGGRGVIAGLCLKRLPDASVLEDVGVEIVQPGAYQTACGKGYWKCGEGEPDKLSLASPAIDLFVYEKAGSFLYFDPAIRGFREVLMSD